MVNNFIKGNLLAEQPSGRPSALAVNGAPILKLWSEVQNQRESCLNDEGVCVIPPCYAQSVAWLHLGTSMVARVLIYLEVLNNLKEIFI